MTTLHYSVTFNHIFSTFLVPSGPVVLEGEPETSTTGIRLSWKPISIQFWNGEEITFQVNVSSFDYTFKKSYVTKTTSAIISGLLPATKYIVDITGKTVFGLTKNRTVVVKTKESKFWGGNYHTRNIADHHIYMLNLTLMSSTNLL